MTDSSELLRATHNLCEVKRRNREGLQGGDHRHGGAPVHIVGSGGDGRGSWSYSSGQSVVRDDRGRGCVAGTPVHQTRDVLGCAVGIVTGGGKLLGCRL